MEAKEVWIEIARQVPAVAAFLIIAGVIVQVFIKATRSLVDGLLEFLKQQSESTTTALNDVADKLETMGTRIVARIEQHDQSVEGRVVSAIERYNGRNEVPTPKKRSKNAPNQKASSA